MLIEFTEDQTESLMNALYTMREMALRIREPSIDDPWPSHIPMTPQMVDHQISKLTELLTIIETTVRNNNPETSE